MRALAAGAFFFVSSVLPVRRSFGAECVVVSTAAIPAPFESRDVLLNLDKRKTALGMSLFFNPALSKDGSLSCASCHQPQHAFSNHAPIARGVNGREGTRNVPVLFNRFGTAQQFWDGRAPSLPAQIFEPILNHAEMDMTEDLLLARIRAIPDAAGRFEEIYGRPATRADVSDALAAFISSIVSGDSRYDRYRKGDTKALTAAELRGKDLFFNQYKCQRCHAGDNFTNEKVMPTCAGENEPPSETDFYKRRYKVPTLRNLDRSGPYLHNGGLSTVGEVLELYNDVAAQGQKTARPIPPSDRESIERFLESLSGPIVCVSGR